MKEELKVGQVFKNYKAICEWLGVKPASGNTKISHMKEFDRYCTYHKEGNKFVIDEVYDEIQEKEDNRKSIFYDDLETIILYALDKEKKRDVNWSIGKSLLLANFVNENFRYCTDKTISDVSTALEVDKKYMYDFYNISRDKFSKIFFTSLKRMQNKGLLDCSECTMVCKRVSIIQMNELGEPLTDERGMITYKTIKEYRPATNDERYFINKAKKSILSELGYTSTNECFGKGKWSVFKKMMNKKLSDTLNIDFYYKGYSIVKNTEYIHDVITEIHRNNCASSVNMMAKDSLRQSNNKKIIKNEEDRDLLIDYLISEDSVSIKTIIKNMSITEEELEENILPF